MAKRRKTKPKRPRVPSYCLHRASGQAYVKIRGKTTYLGVYDTESSRQAYAAIVADVLAGREVSPPKVDRHRGAGPVTVREVCDRYIDHARRYYVKGGKTTAEAGIVASACRYAIDLCGEQPAESFGPLALRSVRDRMIDAGLARTTINGGINRIRRAFKWAAGEEQIPATVAAALATVSGLRAGRTDARETAPIQPAPNDAVEAALEKLPEVVADMVRVQRLTGMRPGEVCTLRPCDLDRSEEVWVYRPATHKTEHHGQDRVVFIGPRAQAILLRYLARDADSCCFRPCDSEIKRRALRTAMRKTAPAQGNRPGTNVRLDPKSQPGDHYSVNGYRQAILRACDRAGVESWRPNQLRHTAATEVRAKFGLEAAQVTLGHSTARTSEIYAEKNLAAGAAVAKAIG